MHADVYNALDGQQQREEPHRARGEEQVDYDHLDAQDRDHAHEYLQSTGRVGKYLRIFWREPVASNPPQ